MKLLVLAGSAEAREIARAAQAGGAEVRALVSEPPRGPDPMPVPCDLHGFEDLSSVMTALAGFDAVLDASHGFDGRMSRLGFEAAGKLGLPFLSYARPAWSDDAADNVHRAKDVIAAMALTGKGARVFSATGWASLSDYAGFDGDTLFLRQTSRHSRPVPFGFVELVFGDPPFTSASETALFKALSIDTLICRNLGGAASRPKVDAAIALGIKVILIARPSLPEGAKVVGQIDKALHWVARQ